MTIYFVDLPIENGGSFHSYGTVYQRVVRGFCYHAVGNPDGWVMIVAHDSRKSLVTIDVKTI